MQPKVARRIPLVDFFPKDKFLRFLAPYLLQAIVEKRSDVFFDRVYPIWIDRFPEGQADPEEFTDRQVDNIGDFKRAMARVLPWPGTEKMSGPYTRWQELSIEADREHRRHRYISHARIGVYKKQLQYQNVLSEEDKACFGPGRTGEERLQAFCDELEDIMWPRAI
ncbi:hypothetical protein FPV67DRAFT_1455250 [Lyophyllum atratum]|nr:hypothetical protein FPV67DRAFT_1455250 [Lyophyllum atratum]